MKNSDIRTKAYVLRRTNYAEADRILNLITPLGKMSVIAKGVRKAKSKFAGAVEMFCLSEFEIHQGKSEMGVLTGARMINYYNKILADLNKMELASEILRLVNRYAEGTDSAEYFLIVDETLSAINDGIDLALIKSWALINLMKVAGEEINLYRDADGEKLLVDERYSYDVNEKAFFKNPNGEYSADEIKIMRLMVASKLAVVARVKNVGSYAEKVLSLLTGMARYTR